MQSSPSLSHKTSKQSAEKWQRVGKKRQKKELSSPAILAQYSSKRETLVSADASSYGLGDVLMQRQPDGGFKPVVSISKSQNTH